MHLWVRAEARVPEARVGVMPAGAAALIGRGFRVTVEHSTQRWVPIDEYVRAGCEIAAEGAWTDAPDDALIFGLKELPADGTALRHRHIMFGHAFKGQPDGQVLLSRFRAGGGALFDLEYLVDETGRRVAAFGYWAGFAGAAVAVRCWAAQMRSALAAPIASVPSAAHLIADLQADLVQLGQGRPMALIIGAKGRVGTGAADLCRELGVATTLWDIAETAHGGPFPEVLDHDVFLNCILARPGTPVFVPATAPTAPRALRVIGDIACDPDSTFSPIKVYDAVTDWQVPARRVHDTPPLDVTAIDNLPSMMPAESSDDFAAQLLPSLLALDALDAGVWGRAAEMFRKAMAAT